MKDFARKRLRALVRSNRGATAVEYSVIVSLIMVGALAALSALGGSILGLWNDVAEKM